MASYLDLVDRSWPVLGQVMRGHAAIYRATGGRIGKFPGLPSLLLLDHVGAKSGKTRTTPLVYMPEGDDYVVVASKGGHPKHPGWLYNLRANPDTTIQIGRRRIPVHAREATDEEREELWPRAVKYNHYWGDYTSRTDRVFPLVILSPRS
jgi:F420H(2)-dependent quinone reductase